MAEHVREQRESAARRADDKRLERYLHHGLVLRAVC
jgi:hypothetical protein